MVNLTINGTKIEVEEGTTILRAAQNADIHIPTLCAHPQLTPYGGCRLCLVEIEGMGGLQPSCTLVATNNMVVHTDTEKLRDARKFILTLLFSERNHFCPFCQVSGGDCELQNAAYEQDMTHWPLQPNYQTFELDASHPYIMIENNRCILCRRCVSACGELVGNFTLGIEERGAKSLLVADLGVPLGESTCISCGMCVQVCPTGTFMDRWSAYQGLEKDVESTNTICINCDVGCGINVVTRDNRLVRIDGDWEAQTNKGIICEFGRYTPMDEKRERIFTPLVRKTQNLKAATWDEALEAVVNHIKPISENNNAGLAALVSTRMPAEVLSLMKEIFTETLHSDMVAALEENQMLPSITEVADSIGRPFEMTLEGLHDADCILSIGADLVKDHQVVGFFVKRLLPKGTKLILAEAKPHSWDQISDAMLKPTSGTHVDVLEGLSAAVVKLGLSKGKPVSHPDAKLKTASEKTDIPAEDFLKAGGLLGLSEKPVIIYGDGLKPINSPEPIKALLEFARLIGALDDHSSRLISVKGKANSITANQFGLNKPCNANGNQAVYVVLGDDQPSEQLVKSLENAPYLIVQACYSSKLTAMADVVLPVEHWLEQEGHFISLDGKIQKTQRALLPPPEVWSNEKVLKEISGKLNINPGVDWKARLNNQVSPVVIVEK